MAGDVYLKLTDHDGESTDSAHKGEIEILSYSAGVSMPVSTRSTSGSATVEKASLSDLSLTKLTDASSAALFKSSCQGSHIKEAILSVNRADGKGGKVEYLKYTLGDVVISSYQVSGSDGGGVPVESFALNFANIKIEYKPTDPATGEAKGSKSGGWDVAANKPL